MSNQKRRRRRRRERAQCEREAVKLAKDGAFPIAAILSEFFGQGRSIKFMTAPNVERGRGVKVCLDPSRTDIRLDPGSPRLVTPGEDVLLLPGNCPELMVGVKGVSFFEMDEELDYLRSVVPR